MHLYSCMCKFLLFVCAFLIFRKNFWHTILVIVCFLSLFIIDLFVTRGRVTCHYPNIIMWSCSEAGTVEEAYFGEQVINMS
jgi:hypothetical protein